jgi:hypothetical protein
VAAAVVEQVEQVVARAERAVVPAAQVRAVQAQAAPAPVRVVVRAPALEAPARVAEPVVQVRLAVQARLVLEQVRLVVRAPALERLVPLAQPAERVVPVLVAQPRAELVPARVRPVLVQREPAAVPAPGELVQERVPAQGPAVVAEAGERAALMSSMRSWAARRRYMSPLPRMSLSSCGLSAASAIIMANRAASSSKPL